MFSVYCLPLPNVSISTGEVTLSSNGTTTLATYICPTGYEVKGEAVLTCNSTGTWNLPASDCGEFMFISWYFNNATTVYQSHIERIA